MPKSSAIAAAVIRRDMAMGLLRDVKPKWVLNPFNDAADFAARKLVTAIRGK